MVSTFSLNDWVLLPGIQLRERVGALPSYINASLIVPANMAMWKREAKWALMSKSGSQPSVFPACRHLDR